MNKINTAIVIVSLVVSATLGVMVYNLKKEVKTQSIYWKVMIENSPKEIQNFFYSEVERLK